MVRSAHGLIPNPAPAVVELLRGAPTYGIDESLELTTPTGAALMAATVVSYGPLPALVVEASGLGAGPASLEDRPNPVQVALGHLAGRMDSRKYNGATLVGLNGIVIKSHGSADSYAFEHAIDTAVVEVRKQVPQQIGSLLQREAA